MQIWIVGLPNVWKSTLFNALTKSSSAEAANYPFCTIDPNIWIVEVPDERLKRIIEVVKPEKSIPATVEFVDIAGLVAGASKWEWLWNKFLSHIRSCNAIAQVLRFFEDSNITHVNNEIHPKNDKETIETGSESAVVVTAKDGTDEFSLVCDNDVVQLAGNEIKEFSFDPRESGYPYCTVEDLKGGTAKENADRLKKCLKGHSMPLDHVVHINSAWGLIAAGKADSLLEGLLMAQESISSGRAYQKLEGLIEMTKGWAYAPTNQCAYVRVIG